MKEICGEMSPVDPIPGTRPLADERICNRDVPCPEHGTQPGHGITLEGAGA